MSILCDAEIRALCERGFLVQPYLAELVNPASIDVRLGTNLLVEKIGHHRMEPYSLEGFTQEMPFYLAQGRFVLAETMETFNVPDDYAGQFALKSSRAREGFEHLMAGYIDPGFHGSKLTLELCNARRYHPLVMWPGMRIGQIVWHRMSRVPAHSYRHVGRYNNDPKVQRSKG
jgi:dCTP deaminase